ncbi:3'(2'),5'-bisphosphate nucleotidase CysQ family protein [Vulgatibacter incomptus]|uniref:3'(2'),5'-bisphosphate nucleotidase n=1 Tax=Vulgatibacter incomptus TaxID=1391653 RepID=A0A0K1P7W4_9BACT|nr:3'(2'),5'-bisphosphate nucleotidase CysQ [Vulgatibacter incomptus]AKU89623.1 3'(2'),5'-bisphosphate nucleotidase [Vulgatibacter incomptus]AKU93327.1 3'(2'),5'-bisphosphate nucleotidase [Vulgatibacter incomptus]
MKYDFTKELQVAARLAREAGRILLDVYDTEYEVTQKPGGGGPVTIADERANAFIVRGLREAFPDDGVVAEESEETSDAARFSRCWFVDPLDGTKEFVQHNDQFAIHIGLAVDGEATVGVVYQPVDDKCYSGVVGLGCTLEERGVARVLRLPSVAHVPMRMVVSRSHRTKRLLDLCESLGIEEVQHVGSVGIKCGMIAAADADLYVHASRISYRWDACAPEVIVRAAGGFFGDMAGQPYRYDGTELQNLRGIVACHPAVLDEVLPAIEQTGREAAILS